MKPNGLYYYSECMLLEWSKEMKISDMIRELCNKKDISMLELLRRIGQTPQSFGKS